MRIFLGTTTLILISSQFFIGDFPNLQANYFLFLIAACLAEGSSVRLPFFGTVSFGLVAYLPLICHPQYGPLPALGTALVCILAREVLAQSSFLRMIDEFVLDLLPLSLAASIPSILKANPQDLVTWLAVGLTFVTSRHIVVKALSSGLAKTPKEVVRRLQSNTSDIRWGLLAVSLVAVSLSQQNPLLCLVLVPIILSLRRAAIHAYAWLDAADKSRLRAEAGQLSKSLTQAESHISKLAGELESTASERDLLSTLSQQTAKCGSVSELLVLVNNKCQTLRLGSEVELLLREPAGWLLYQLDSKGRPKVMETKFEDLGLGFRRTWKNNQFCLSKKSGRAFFPMPGVGVFSFLKSFDTDSHQELVQLFSSQVALASLSARRFEMLERALGQLAEINDRLQVRNEVLVALTYELQELSAAKSINDAFAKLPKTAALLVGGQALIAVSLEEGGRSVLHWKAREHKPNSIQQIRTDIDTDHCWIISYDPDSMAHSGGDLLEVGIRCATEIFGQLLLSRSLQKALERLRSSEAQLIQSAKLAAVGQLSAGLAHEINNPLGSIRLALEVTLRKETLADFSKTLLEKALAGVARAESITGSLLSYSRAGDKGKTKISGGKVVSDACSFLSASLKMRNIKFEIRAADSEFQILANAQEIQQIVTNLIMNAADAVADSSSPLVRVEMAERDGDFLVLVHDNGAGVPADLQSLIFDPFFTTKPVGKGTGLGLSVSRQLAEAHNGKLERVENPPLGGATFCLHLPLYS